MMLCVEKITVLLLVTNLKRICFANSVKSDDKYVDVLSRLVVLLNIVSEAPSHVQAQESIVVT